MGSKSDHFITSILWNKDTESVKSQYTVCTSKIGYYMRLTHGNALGARKAKYKQLR
jgi:hypothetical protein